MNARSAPPVRAWARAKRSGETLAERLSLYILDI
nr:MAG TPA: hypothetical protein [Microviridae sp.]